MNSITNNTPLKKKIKIVKSSNEFMNRSSMHNVPLYAKKKMDKF